MAIDLPKITSEELAHRQEVLDRAIAASGFTEVEIREQAATDELQNFQACFAWALMRDPEPAPDQEASQ